jgi:hypothetical protein
VTHVINMQTKQATTGVVAVVRPWSGTGAFAFTAPRGYTGLSIAPTTPNHRIDLSPAIARCTVSGTTDSSPPA